MEEIKNDEILTEEPETEATLEEHLKITPGTIARTVILAIAIINRILARFGHPIIDIDSGIITEFVADAWLIVTALIAWWKNNSFTLPALAGDIIMRALRKGDKNAN